MFNHARLAVEKGFAPPPLYLTSSMGLTASPPSVVAEAHCVLCHFDRDFGGALVSGTFFIASRTFFAPLLKTPSVSVGEGKIFPVEEDGETVSTIRATLGRTSLVGVPWWRGQMDRNGRERVCQCESKVLRSSISILD